MFAVGTPILREELYEEGFTDEELGVLVEQDKLRVCEFVTDVYYTWEKVIECGLEFESVVSFKEAAIKKYIGLNLERGFVCGYSLMNGLGLTTQVPYVTELCSIIVDERISIGTEWSKVEIIPFSELFVGEVYNKDNVVVYFREIVYNRLWGWSEVPKQVAEDILQRVEAKLRCE